MKASRLAFTIIAFLLAAESGFCQKVTGTVKVFRERLQGRNLDLFEGLERQIENFVNSNDWSRTGDETPLPLDIQIYLDRVSESGGENLVSATLYVSNRRELQYRDNGCIFTFAKGAPLQRDPGKIHPFLSIIEFYIYIMLGDELDTVGRLLGTSFFQEAKGLAIQAKTLFLYNAKGWDDRQLRADAFLDPRYLDYRLMRDHFFEAEYQYQQGDSGKAEGLAQKVVSMLPGLLAKTETAYHTERFIQLRYLDICKFLSSTRDRKVFDRLAELDPKNKDTYLRFKEGKL